jgi:hypothetical protein
LTFPNSRFIGHLPRTLIDLNSSMSASACWQQMRFHRPDDEQT